MSIKYMFWYIMIPACFVIYIVADLVLIKFFKSKGYYNN